MYDVNNFPIFLAGPNSSGKSSFLNSLAGGIVSTSSSQREVFHPEKYIFTNTNDKNILNVTGQLEQKHQENKTIKHITTNNIKANDYILQTKHGLNNYNVIDFPGHHMIDYNTIDQYTTDHITDHINDHIPLCDLLIYVTDTQQNTTHTTHTSHLDTLINKEKEKGHYMDYIVVINKYDDVDLDENYTRTNNKIFRYSSHRVLIDYIIKEKKKLIIPKHMKKELSTILKNSDIPVTNALKKKINNKTISYTNLKYTIDDVDYSKYNIRGDWDDVIGHIKSSQVNKKTNAIKLLNDNFNDLIKNKQNTLDHLMHFLNRFDDYIKIMSDNGIVYDELLEQVILNYVHELTISELEDIIPSIIYKYNQQYPSLYDTLINSNKIINSRSLLSLLLYENRKFPKTFTPLCALLKNKNTWQNFIHGFYNIQEMNISIYVKKNGKFKHNSWFISNLLIDSHETIHKLVMLALTPLHQLKALERANIVPYDIIKLIDPDLQRYDYYLCKLSNTEILEHRLFGIDEDDRSNWEAYVNRHDYFIKH
jgi:energy-coupling factor transporter ATP-binding protein EcfA2